MEKAVVKYLVYVLFLILAIIGWNHTLYAQNNPLQRLITLKKEQQHLATILESITSDYQIEFSYNSNIIKPSFINNIDVVETPLHQLLSDLLNDYSIGYKDVNEVIVLFKNEEKSASSTNKIYGYVTEEGTGKPIPHVNVFFSNTTIGTTTGEDGFYQLPTILNVPRELVFSHVSYYPAIRNITISLSQGSELSLVLKEMVTELNEIVITSSRKDWEKYLKIFEREFLGTTPNSTRCKLMNPWILDFNYDPKTDMLKATAQDLLLVKNEPLGYNVSHLLVLFEYQNGKTRYLTKSKFEEIPSQNKAQERKWEKKRQEAFLGSFEHFMQALTGHNLKKNGFEITLVNSLTDYQAKTSIKSTDIVHYKGLVQEVLFQGYLEIFYKDSEDISYSNFVGTKKTQSSYQTLTQPYKRQHSILEIIAPEGYLIIDSGIINPLSIKLHGYWSWKRMADLLPLNFRPNIDYDYR